MLPLLVKNKNYHHMTSVDVQLIVPFLERNFVNRCVPSKSYSNRSLIFYDFKFYSSEICI